MATEIEIHSAQVRILRSLLFKTEIGFGELNDTKLTSDHFTFHIKRLVELKLVAKNDNKKYELTATGKEFANRLDTEKMEIERQAKIGVLIVPTKRTGGKSMYLAQQRLKQPFYGYWGFVTGKARWGETVYETAERELDEETGLAGKLKLVGVKHKMDYSADGKLLEDKHFFVFRAESLKGKLIREFEGGKNVWKTKREMLGIGKLFDGVEEAIGMADGSKLRFVEDKYEVKEY